MNCPCGSGDSFEQCCQRFISQRLPAGNAEQLMRSRYSAYLLGNREYLESSWHPDYRPRPLTLDADVHWIGLQVIHSHQQADEATVEFEARLLVQGKVDAMHENSRFVRHDGQWFYTDGDILPPSFTPWKPGRNENCPCGSGLKFKRCCASC